MYVLRKVSYYTNGTTATGYFMRVAFGIMIDITLHIEEAKQFKTKKEAMQTIKTLGLGHGWEAVKG